MQAGRHSYYGGVCCQSCRAFFRRCVKNKYYTSMACREINQRCKVTIKNRKKCMACRFNKCLEAGEILSLILIICQILPGLQIRYVLIDMDKKVEDNLTEDMVQYLYE